MTDAGGPPAPGAFDWQREGRRIGDSLDSLNCVVVLGEDPDATAKVALGIARAQAGRRRVAVGDLLGEAEPLQSLVTAGDPFGLVDSFLYGVSMNRIARAVPEAGELYILPSGSEDIDYDEIVPSPRWRRLAAGFRSEGALLLVAAPASAPRIEELVAVSDGAILVGDTVPPQLPVAQVISSVRQPRSTLAPVPAVNGHTPVLATAGESPKRRGFPPALGIGLALFFVLVAVVVWLAVRPLDRTYRSSIQRPRDSTLPGSPPPLPGTTLAPDTLTVDATQVPDVVNRGDSATASGFAVSWLKMNTESGAILKLTDDGKGLPAVTWAKLLIGGAPWYELRVGAYPTREEAESLLTTLQGNNLVERGGGAVIRAPLAFVVDSTRSLETARSIVAKYTDRGLPAYALRRTSGGGVRVYVGAFQTPVESSLYAESLRSLGITPVLVYRTGRVF